MSDTPLEAQGAPDEEHLSMAKAKEQLDTDPDKVDNAPNRDPHEMPDEAADDDQDPDVEPWRSERPREDLDEDEQYED